MVLISNKLNNQWRRVLVGFQARMAYRLGKLKLGLAQQITTESMRIIFGFVLLFAQEVVILHQPRNRTPIHFLMEAHIH